MKICHSIAQVRQVRAAMRRTDASIGLVPTMGALHAGHLSLVRAAREQCGAVVATIFVNPTQFAPGEDFDKYPRTWDDDVHLLTKAGVDLLFAPQPEEMYPSGAETFVDVGPLGTRLDGASRPGHFRGVATVVSKLFHIVSPDLAFFGQKDAAQVAVLRAMVRDLNFPLSVVVCPTVRDADGLALSSRNRYLSPEERTQALALLQSLRTIEQQVHHGETSATTLRTELHRHLSEAPGLRVDYAELVDPNTLLPVNAIEHETLAAVAAWVGSTRLIDNVLLQPSAA
jgi:pantoate--beta-alanine ligase